jgi:hypothetical protein
VVTLFSQALHSEPIETEGVDVWYDVPTLLKDVSRPRR